MTEDNHYDDLLTLNYYTGGTLMHDRSLSEVNELDYTESKVVHPTHYRGKNGLEVRDVQENFVPYYERWGVLVASDIKDAIKYILRAPRKNGSEDLEKARYMLEYAINGIKEKEDDSKTY